MHLGGELLLTPPPQHVPEGELEPKSLPVDSAGEKRLHLVCCLCNHSQLLTLHISSLLSSGEKFNEFGAPEAGLLLLGEVKEPTSQVKPAQTPMLLHNIMGQALG